jgi:hypothetical protein
MLVELRQLQIAIRSFNQPRMQFLNNFEFIVCDFNFILDHGIMLLFLLRQLIYLADHWVYAFMDFVNLKRGVPLDILDYQLVLLNLVRLDRKLFFSSQWVLQMQLPD